VQGYIHKLETLKPYEFPFERLRRVEEQYKGKKKTVKDEDGKDKEVDASSSDEEEKKEEEEKKDDKLGEIKEVENEDEDVEGKAEEAKKDPNESILGEAKNIMEKLKKPSNSLDLNDIDAEEAKIELDKLA
jgi:hypothetical protein